jgi:3-phenylpropionate/cinnamic acid dioxygenase small subunit
MDRQPRAEALMSDAVQQISDLMFRYAELFDTGQFDEFAALFEH